ncbi:PIR protein [Plasmodium yoelii]|nr:PIR protein [Plasmodium yoelii]VTZ81110.1 PIR protein [Plasmodium yoelii]|eukprot:XP_022813797.1 PIR protein [Plasmodium yoelii]
MPVYLCDGINLMDRGILFDQASQNYTLDGSHTEMHCPDNKCDDDNKKLSSAFIAFIAFFNGAGIDENLDSDKIAEYAILWLGHKLNQKKENETTTLNDFYTKHVKTNSHYNQKINTNSSNKIKKNDIENKINSMNIGIKDMSNFYEVFKLLCKMDGELDPKKKPQCNKCLESAREFFEKCEKVKNAFDINKGSSYLQLLSILSNDYKQFKEKYKKVVCSNVEFLETCSRSSVTESPVTKCQVTECPVTKCQVTECPVTKCQVTESPVTKNTLIIIAIIFVAASILLGVSYKYSLFGFRKRSQKQHLREKLKK